jgi:hypothetical protein
MAKNPVRFFIVFALFWSALVLVFDGFIAKTFLNQMRSRSFATTQALILSSEITTHDSSDSITYGARVVYEFTVDGHRYQSDRVRFGQGSDSTGRWAHETVAANQPGASRTVYYDPINPTRSVLQRGVEGQDWFLALFLTPFNVVMIFLWGMVVKARQPAPPQGGARIVTEPDRILVYMPTMPRSAAALLVFGMVSFAGIFALVIPFGFSPKAEYMWGVWAFALGASLFTAFRTRNGAPSSTPELIIDADGGRLLVPKGLFSATKSWRQWREWKKAGQPALEIALERIRDAVMRERISRDSDGESRTYVVALLVEEPGEAGPREFDVGSWMLPDQAESFAVWLRETLGVTTPAR